MTSTGFNIGLDGSRSSSRVLKPPGGGHTDIFGGEDQVKVGRKYHGRNQSSILEGTNPGSDAPETPPEEVKVAASEPAQEARSNAEQASGEPRAAAAAPPAPANPAQSRVRVPPGGFSSEVRNVPKSGDSSAVDTERIVPIERTKFKIDPSKFPPKTKIDVNTIALLEKLTLVDLKGKAAIETLEVKLEFADQILQVPTDNVEPLVSLLEDHPCRIREDIVTEGNCRDEVLSCATLTEEEYFVAPPGNIPLDDKNDQKSPTGLLLCQNLNTEWFYNIVLNKDVTVVLNDGDFSETFDYTKSLCSEKLPFGIADVKIITNSNLTQGNNAFDNVIQQENDTLLKFCMFVSPTESTRLFHQWQKLRRTWYKRFSDNPERYSITDIKTNGDVHSADIVVEYPWGSNTIESLELNTQNQDFSTQQLEFKERKTISAHTITGQVNLSTLFLNYLCDCYVELPIQSNLRSLWRFHRKLAPYKLSFAMTGSSQAVVHELNDLALYLCKQFRANHVSTLLLPSSSKNSLESQYKQYDQWGIPYTVVLNERTLKDGISNLRSRDTTLKEQVHVTDLVNYVDKIFKNY
ncbi:unnamed protein product [Phyllotreta striolata]|uniref:Glutamyl-tRNA(Gln) amidotransferase subunit C, mitochondrial n=1 Tax=Phyllotreta striolata TaxID=444603 RepID=A0A9N9XQC3_PHYSR|nr:unnamed protein product [Phyllotreta striolata]